MISLPDNQVKDMLLRAGVVDEKSFELVKTEALRKNQNPIDVLISEGVFTRDYFYLLLAKTLGLERVNLGTIQIDEAVMEKIPEEVARQKKVIVFGRDADGAYLAAMEDPSDLETIDFLKRRLNGFVKAYLATEEDLNRGYLLYNKQLTQDFKKIIEESVQETLRLKARGALKEVGEDLPVVAIIDNLLSYAISSRSSDVHIEALDDAVYVRFRIDGVLHEIITMPKEIRPAIVARIKILSSLRVDEHTHPQDGRFRYAVGDQFVDIRVSILPTFYGEKVEMRLLADSQRPLSFQSLGMFDDSIKLLQEGISKTYGMVLVCGPTGSGKSTTLYSVLNVLNHPEVNIVTIEDPIEYDMRYVNQIQVNPAAGITFASGLRSILRQDPNIIMVGEVRDGETANIAVQAALTGHLVLSSLHTNDAPTAIPRLVDMGIPPFLVSAVLNVVSAQRLARRICRDCIESYTPPAEIRDAILHEVEGLKTEGDATRLPKVFYRGKGCRTCSFTGFLGRMTICEVMPISEAIRKLIIDPHFDLDELRLLARKEGMVTMIEDGLRKVELGLTTIEEVFRIIRE
jgi:type IV pilus assembly protein PilB